MKEIEYERPSFEKEEESWSKKKKPQSSVPTVRTFRADVQELIKEKGTTKTDIALAEAARREARGEKRFPVEEEGSHLGRVILILVFILAFGLGVGGYALFGDHLGSLFGGTATSTPPSPTTEDIVVDLYQSPKEQALADISIAFGKTYLPTGGKRAIIFTTKDGNGDSHTAGKEEFFTAIAGEKLPDALVGSLDARFSYQVYSSSTLSGIIFLGSRSYANTYAAMLEWEPDMAEKLIPALDPWYNRKALRNLRDREWKDERYGGVNFRTLYDLDNDPVLSYGFIDKRTLIIAGKPDGIRSVIAEKAQL